jgi:L-fuculose-phosphate aldolase
MADEQREREAIVAASRRLVALGLNRGASGNISVRFGDGLLVTPSGVPPDRLEAGAIVAMGRDGTWSGPLKPSSEWRIHRDILGARPEIGAVVHAHPPYATAFAICGQDIPAVHYMIALAGGPSVRCAPYATFGTAELSAAALAALEARTCCLLANHGTIATGQNLDGAMHLAVELEELCRQYAIALTIRTPNILPDDEITRNVALFRGYGPRSTDAG